MSRTIVITGASDGLGAVAARQLHRAGEEVVVVGRDPEKTAKVGRELGVAFFVADFADFAQVRELAASLLDAYPRIDVLANNAGGVFGDRTLTIDGHELTFQVNHLAPFLLTNLLMERLVASSAAVVQTASAAAQLFARFDIDDLEGERRYRAGAAYGNSKLANILFTKELHRRHRRSGLAAVAFHPGVFGSSFATSSKGLWRFFYAHPFTRRFLASTETAASRLTWLALGTPGVDWRPGEYYSNNRVARAGRLAADPVIARMLWERSAEAVGLPSDH